MFYETKNSLGSTLLRIEEGLDFSFPAHLHGNFELIIVTDGEMVVTVDNMQYTLTAGKAVLVFPNQIHTLHTKMHSRHILCIFSPRLIQAYSNIYLGKLPECHLFSPPPFCTERLFRLREQHSELQAKGLLYSICGEFDASAGYYDRVDHHENLLLQIFRFVEERYSEDCSLAALATHTAYHSVYLSRYFKQNTGISYTDHVNRYRVSEAAYSLRNSKKNILEIALESGYNSLRSFNRNFKAIMGMTPNAYRNSG